LGPEISLLAAGSPDIADEIRRIDDSLP